MGEDQAYQAHTSFKDEIYARRIKSEEIFVLCFLCCTRWQVARSGFLPDGGRVSLCVNVCSVAFKTFASSKYYRAVIKM